jgi:hypothetical protein
VFGIIINNIVRATHVRKYGDNLIRKLTMGLKKSNIEDVAINWGNFVLIITVILLESIRKTGAISIMVR